MVKYFIVNNNTGNEIIIEHDPGSIEESKWFWNLLGWSVFPCENQNQAP